MPHECVYVCVLCVCVCVCVCVQVLMCVCCLMYIHVYIFINTALFNTDMYIYIYVCTKMYQYVMKNTDIAVLGHADGICHTYVDKTADLEMAVEIASDAKIQCVAVCCSVARVVAVCRILLQCVVRAVTRCSVLQCGAVELASQDLQQ